MRRNFILHRKPAFSALAHHNPINVLAILEYYSTQHPMPTPIFLKIIPESG
jgi:hypothetical protein